MTARVRLDGAPVWIAAALVCAGIGIAFVPGADAVLPESVQQLEQEYDPSTVSRTVAAVLALYVVWRLHRTRRGARSTARSGDSTHSATSSDDATAPTAVRADAGGDDSASRVVGRDVTRAYDRQLTSLRSASGAPEPEPSAGLRNAVEAVERASGADADTASDRVERGAWTDDPIAAAFVGGSDAGSVPFWRRVYAILYPGRAFERRFDRTLAAAERAAADVRDGDRSVPAAAHDAPPSDATEPAADGGTDADAAADRTADAGAAANHARGREE